MKNCYLQNNPYSEFINQLKAESDKNIWVLGGSQLIKWILNNEYIDELIIFIIPVIIGGGIPLFQKEISEKCLKLEGTETFDTGVVNLHYSNLT